VSAAEAISDPAPATRAALPLFATVIRDLSGLEALRPDWQQLSERARASCLFLTYEWLAPWWQQFGAGRELRCLALHEGRDGKLAGLLLLFVETVRMGFLPVRRLAFLGDGTTGCDYLDVLAEPGREAEVLSAMLDEIGKLEWDLLDLDGLSRDSATALSLAQRFPNERLLHDAALGEVVRDGKLRYVCPHIPLRSASAPANYEQYLSGLGRRENLRRREKWLSQKPGTSIEVARTPAEAAIAIGYFLELHRARWAADGGSDGLADARFDEFHRAATQLLAERGMLRLYTLYAARRPVASVYGVVHRGKFLYYQSGYDPLWASRSVGLVLLARTVSDAFAEGLAEFDFLRGNEGYKAQWKRAERWTVQLRFWRGGRGRAAKSLQGTSTMLRDAFKGALPASFIEAVKKTRRILRAPPPGGESRLTAALQVLRAQLSSNE